MFTAYAKINLGLLVIGKRPDGYHDIETVFHRVKPADELVFEPDDTISVRSDSAQVPSGEENICYRAATLLREALGVRQGVRITIAKKIPAGAGLGGGSSDAATVVRELPAFWGTSIPGSRRTAIALELGSDVPYFLGSGTALASGRGEILQYFNLDVPFTILLCHPALHVSTAWAYQQVRPSGSAQRPDLRSLVVAGMSNPLALVNGLRNDFEPAVFRQHPEVLRVKEMMYRGGAVFASMSGSGSAVYGLFRREGEASDLQMQFSTLGYRTFMTPPHFSPDGPVA